MWERLCLLHCVQVKAEACLGVLNCAFLLHIFSSSCLVHPFFKVGMSLPHFSSPGTSILSCFFKYACAKVKCLEIFHTLFKCNWGLPRGLKLLPELSP